MSPFTATVRRARSLALRVGALAIAACTPSAQRTDNSDAHPYVVMVSFDAFRADYIDRYHPPALSALAARGVRAEWMTPSFPSKTFPNHYTLATGLYPGHHGIVGNAFYDPSRRQWYRISQPVAVRDSSWYGGEPIWVTAEKNGVKAGTYFWSGSEAAIGGVRPTYYTIYDARVPNEQRVNSVISWLRKPAAERPHLAMLYISEVDDTTHRNGPDAPNTARAVADVDHALGVLIDSIRALPFADSVNVVVVSDHGMVETSPSRLIDVSDVLNADTVGVEMSDNGPTLSLWFGGDSVRATRAFNALRTRAHMQAYTRTKTPERWHTAGNPRVGDILLVADEGWIIEHSARDRSPTTGAHGYDPALASMRATFVAAGPNVRNTGVIPAFENVNVYPFIAALLRLQRVPKVDGDLSVLRANLR